VLRRQIDLRVVTVTYHRFVNTTPNPRATKNSSGELVGPPLLPLPPLVPVVVAEALAALDARADVVDDMIAVLLLTGS
jgi:hypothetical protein